MVTVAEKDGYNVLSVAFDGDRSAHVKFEKIKANGVRIQSEKYGISTEAYIKFKGKPTPLKGFVSLAKVVKNNWGDDILNLMLDEMKKFDVTLKVIW